MSHLRVYDSAASDGLRGGTPHVHSVCTEAYAVIRGHGEVHTLGPNGFAAMNLEPGSLVWFGPGTIHRLVNVDGELEIFVLMQNAGLPEAGDLVITFPDEILADPEAYRAAATLPGGEQTTDGSGDAARARRDLGVEGYLLLRAAMEAGDESALTGFYERVAGILAPRARGWFSIWEEGPLSATRATEAQIDSIASGDFEHLLAASVQERPPPPRRRRMGCCGTLGEYLGGWAEPSEAHGA